MATYKPKKKIDKNGTLEEVKIPIESVDGLDSKLNTTKSLIQDLDEKVVNEYATKAEIADKIGIEEVEYLDMYMGMVEPPQTDDGIYWSENAEFRDKHGAILKTAETFHHIPISSGEGIKFEQDEEAAQVKISTDLPTVKAKLTPASEVGGGSGLDNLGNIDTWMDLPYDLEIAGPDGVSWNEAYVFYDKDENVIASGDMTHRIPLQAGEGIEFIADNENNIVKINSTVEVPINMFVATTEQEFNSLITIENAGKAISYNKKMYLIVVNSTEPNPPKVGDVITALYFNTNITPDLSSVANTPISITKEDGTTHTLVYNRSGTQQLFVYRIFSSGATVVYSTSTGWSVDHFILEQPLTVSETEEEDTWSNFISKTPFGYSATTVEICVGEIPKKTSQLENDSDFATNSSVDEKIADLATVAISGNYNDLSNKPTIPTSTSQLTNNSDFATNSSVDTKIANLVNSAPEALNTLGELASALEDHEDAYDALLEVVGNKADKNEIKTLVANTQEEFDALIVKENCGKTISYDGKLYLVRIKELDPSPLQVGDVITELYFDENAQVDLSSFGNSTVYITVLFDGDTGSTSMLYKSADTLYIKVERSSAFSIYKSNAWVRTSIALKQSAEIKVLSQQSLWSHFISKTPFRIVDAVEVGGAGFENIAHLDNHYTSAYVDENCIAFDGISELEDKNGTAFSFSESMKLPITAGEGIEFEQDAENNVVKINATGGSGGGISGAWTSGTSGSIALPSAGTYQIKSIFSSIGGMDDATVSSIVYWDGVSQAVSPATFRVLTSSAAFLFGFFFLVEENGVIQSKALQAGSSPLEMSFQQATSYRKIGEA